MKHAVSVSLGSSKRNKSVKIERIGTDGDMEKAAQLYKEMDGQVDAFGVGGADLGLMVDEKWYPLHSVKSMVRFIKKTPVVDGTGLKITLEHRVTPYMDAHLGDYIASHGGKKALVTMGADRWGLTIGLVEGGYECVFGDLMFGLGVGIPLRKISSIKRLASLLMPIAEKQEVRIPKFEKYYSWATVIAGDRHYIMRHLPDNMSGKIVITNTTTESDVELFKSAGIQFLVTATPVIEGRSFGTNMMEAALIAVSGKGRQLTYQEYDKLLNELKFEPKIMELN
jgi:hypothetical protein